MGIYKTGPLHIGQIVFGLLDDDDAELGSGEREAIGHSHRGVSPDEPLLSLLRRARAAPGADVERARHVTPTPA